jgi:hypothetical protein
MKKYYSIVVLLGLLGCKNPLEDFVLGFKEPIEVSTVRMQFNLPEEGKLPKDISLKVLGPDQDKMVTNLNSKKFKISREGVIVFAVSPDFEASASTPIRFSVEVIAEGYLKILKEFVIAGKGNQTFNARFIKAGTTGSLSTVQLPLMPGTLGINDTSERIFLEVGDNLVYKGWAGDVLNGDKDLVMLRYNHLIAKNNLPAGGIASSPIGPNDQPLVNSFDFHHVASLAIVQASTKLGNVIKAIDPGFKLKMELHHDVFNPLFHRKIASGDVVDIVSYDTDRNVWKWEGQTAIKGAQPLFVEFPVNHLSYWIVGWKRDLCKNGPNFKFQTGYSDVDIAYLGRLKGATTGRVIKEYYTSINNGSTLSIRNLPDENESVKLELYDFNNYHGGNNTKPIAISEAMSLCKNQDYIFRNIQVTLPKYVEIEMYLDCADGGKLDPATLPSQMRIQYSEVGKNQWRDAGIVRREQQVARTYRLGMGKRYDIRASSDNGVTWPFYQNNQLINKTKWPINVKIFGGKCI